MEIRAFFSADTKQLDTAKDKLADVGDAGQESGRDISKGMQKAEQSTGVLQSALKGLGGVLATMGLAAAASELIDVSRAMGNAVGEVASLGVATSELNNLSQQALESAGDFGVMATDFVAASYDIQSAISGLNPGELGTITASMSTLAIGTKSTTDVMTNMMGTMYGIFQNAADKMGVGVFSEQVAAFTAKSVQAFKTTGSAMSQAFTTVGAIGEKMGASMSEQFAILGTLQATMPGAEAGTKYKAFMEGVIGAQKKLGLSFIDSQGKMLPTVQILEKIKGKFGELDAVEISKIKSGFGSSEATAFVTALIGKTDQLQGSINDIAQSDFSLAKEMAEKIADPFDKAAAATNALKIKLGNLILPSVNSFMEGVASTATSLTGKVDVLADQWGVFVENLKTGDGIYAVIREGFNGISTAISPVLPYLTEFAGWMAGSGAAIGAATIALGGLAAAFALLTSPITLVIAAVAAVGMAVSHIYNNWDSVVAWWAGMWTDIQATGQQFMSWWNGATLEEKTADIVTGSVELARTATTSFFKWWDGSTLKKHSPEFILSGVEKARELTGKFFTWWDSSTLEEKATHVKTEAIATATSIAERFTSWWNGSTLTEKYTEVSTFYLDTAEASAGKFINWWNGSVLAELVAPIDTNPVTAAREKATAFIGWWNASPLSEKLADIETNPIELARTAATSFFNWWDASTLKKHSPQIVTDAIESARQSITGFFNWWDNTSLTEKTADVTAETLIWAWEQAQKFEAWWNNLSLKSLVPEIKMPTMAGIKDSAGGMWDWAKGVGGDIADGIGLGIDRADAHISAAKKAAKGIETAVRTELDTHSPSRVMAAVGLDVSTGFAVGIESGGSKIQSAAEKAAKAANDAFNSIVQGLEKQYLKLTQGDEAVRRYELSMKGIVGSNQDAVIAAEAHIKSLDQQSKQHQETAKIAKKAADDQARSAKQLTDSLLTPLEKHSVAIKKYDGLLKSGAITQETYGRAVEKQAKALADATGVTEAAKKAQDAINRVMESGKRLTESMRRPQEIFSDAIGEYEKLLKTGAITQETYNRALADQKKKLDDATGATAAAKAKQDAYNKVMDEGKKVLESVKTDAEKYADETKRLNKLLQAGAIDSQTYQRAMDKVGGELDATKIKAKELADEVKQMSADINASLTDAFLSGDFSSIGSSLVDIFKKDIAGPIMNKVMKPLADAISNSFSGIGNSISNSLGFGNQFGTTGTGGGIMNTLMGGGMSGGLMAGGLGMMAGQMFGQTGIGSGIGAGIGNMLFPGIGGAVGGLLGGLVESLFGGGPQKITGRFGSFGSVVQEQQSIHNRDDRTFYQTGRSDRSFQRTSALGQFGVLHDGSVSIGRDDESQIPAIHAALDAIEAIHNALAGLVPDTEEGAAALAAMSAAIDGFESDALDTATLVKENTRVVFDSMSKGVQLALMGAGDTGFFQQSMEEIAARIEYVGQVSAYVQPMIEAIGLQLSDSWDMALRDAALLTDSLGGVEAAMSQLMFYAENFIPEAELMANAVDNNREQLMGWNESIGMTGDSVIDTREEFRAYIESLDLTTEAGRNAAAAAFEQMEALLSVANATQVAKEKLDAVAQATYSLNLNFDPMSAGASSAATALIDFMGGLEAFSAATSNYYDKFYSEAEKTDMIAAQAAAAVAAFNEAQGLSGTAAIDTAAEFRNYVESLDLTTEAGREAYAEAMALADSMKAVADSGMELDELMSSLPEKVLANAVAAQAYADGLEESATKTDEAASSAEKAMSLVETKMTTMGDAANDAAGAVAGAANMIAGAVTSINSALDAANSAAKSAQDAASKADENARSQQSANTDGLPKFALGGITSGISIAGEAGPEAVIPLPDGRSVPVALSFSGVASVAANDDGASDSAKEDYAAAIKSAQDYAYELANGAEATLARQRADEGWTQAMVDSAAAAEAANQAASKQAEAKSAYDDAMQAAQDYAYELANGAEATLARQRADEGWTQAMVDSAAAAEAANQAASKQAEAKSAYNDAMQAAQDYAYELANGAEATLARQRADEGWTQAMVDSTAAAEAANQAASQQAEAKSAYNDAMQAAQDYAYELEFGSEALRVRTLLEQGWSQQMIDNLLELEKANEAAAAALDINQAAIDAMNEQRESEIETYKRLQAAAKTMRETLDALFYDEELTLASPLERLEAARNKVDELAETAARDPEAAEALSSAVTDALKLSREYNASTQAYVDDYESMTGILDRIAGKIESMPDPRKNSGSSGAPRLSNGMLFVPGMNLDGTWVDGSHANGLSSVPFDGYKAELHAGEMVLPASAANALRDMGVPVNHQIEVSPNVIDARPVFNQQAQNSDQQREIAELRKQNAEQQKQIIGLLTELRDDQREIGGDAHQQREEQKEGQSESKEEIRMMREDSRNKARFEDAA